MENDKRKKYGISSKYNEKLYLPMWKLIGIIENGLSIINLVNPTFLILVFF
jgi:hypothetical protein